MAAQPRHWIGDSFAGKRESRSLGRCHLHPLCGPGGADCGDCSNPLAPCASVQYALDQVGSGDLIKVTGGIYTGVSTRSSTYSI